MDKVPTNKQFLTTITGQFKNNEPIVFYGHTPTLQNDRFITFFDGYRLDYLNINMEITHVSEIDALMEFLKYTRFCFVHLNNIPSPRNPDAGGEYKKPNDKI